MPIKTINNPKFQALTSTGAPLSGGLLYTYTAGTSTPKATYSDIELATPNANPVVLDSRGEATVYGLGAYKFVLKTSADVEVWTVDNITAATGGELTLVGISDYANDLTAAVAAIGATESALFMDADSTISANTTIPSTLKLLWFSSRPVSGSFTLTFNGGIEAGKYQIFDPTLTLAGSPKCQNVYPQWFGAVGDGVTDDTDAVQNALDFAAENTEVVIPAGTYMIESVTKNINIPSNTHLTFSPGAEWKAITNSSDTYIVMDIRDVTDVFIYNPVITGDRDTHTGVTGEQGHCINISSSGTTDNVHIYNPVVTKAWGDNIVIRNGTNIHFYDAFTDSARRNNITINKGETIHFHGTTYAANTNGTSPEAGVDIEPNDATGELKNIVFDKLITANNTGPGLTINIGDFANGGNDREITILVLEHYDTGSVYGLNMDKIVEGATETISGKILFGSQTYINNDLCGVYYNDYASDNTPHVFMENLSILNPNANNSASTQFGAGFAFDRKAGSGATNNIGNCTINNLRIVDDRVTNQMTRGINAIDNDVSGASLENVFFNDPIKISGYDAAGDAFQVSMKGMKLSDKYRQFERTLTGNLSLTSRAYSKLSTTNAAMFTVTDALVKDNGDLPLELFTTGAGGIRFVPEASRQVYPLSAVAGKYVESTTVGARLKLEYHLTDDTWYVLEQLGTWSVEP